MKKTIFETKKSSTPKEALPLIIKPIFLNQTLTPHIHHITPNRLTRHKAL